MPERAALLIAVETFFEAGPPMPYASVDWNELVRDLQAVGYRGEKCLQISGHRSTKAGFESFLRRLPKLVGKVDSLLVAIATRAFSHKGHGYLACADTLTVDPLETSLPVADLLAALHRTRCREVTLLLDVDSLDAVNFAIEVDPGLDSDELEKLLDASPSCVLLLSASPGEQSHASGTLKHGVWRHHVLEAIAGKARNAADAKGIITAASLHAHLEESVPRTLRRLEDPMASQTPRLYGEANAASVLADVSPLLESGREVLLDPARLRRVVFRSEATGRVKELAGFRKSHGLPEHANEWAKKFVTRIALPDIQADLDTMFDVIRDAFGYKRKDLDVSVERDGQGFLRTPDFDYTVSATVDSDNPTAVVWRREIGRVRDPEFVRSDAFKTAFGPRFDKLVFDFAVPVDVAAFVDRLEESPMEGVKMSIGSDSDRCVLSLAGFAGKATLTRHSLTIEGRTPSSVGLLDQFLAFLAKFGPMGESKALVPRKNG